MPGRLWDVGVESLGLFFVTLIAQSLLSGFQQCFGPPPSCLLTLEILPERSRLCGAKSTGKNSCALVTSGRDGNDLEKVIQGGMAAGHPHWGQPGRRWMGGVRQITGRSAAERAKVAMDGEAFQKFCYEVTSLQT